MGTCRTSGSLQGGTSELAALMRRCISEMSAFDFNAPYLTDQEAEVLAETTFTRTMREIADVPARTRDDALAALDWLIFLWADLSCSDWDPYPEVTRSLLDAIRNYIEAGFDNTPPSTHP